MNYLPALASDQNPPDLNLSNTHEPPAPGNNFLFLTFLYVLYMCLFVSLFLLLH
jgi:hypothetical protein